MIVDCHTHIGRNNHINATAEQLIKSMDEAGIDKSFVFSGELNDAPLDWVLQSIAPYKNRLYAVAGYNNSVPCNQGKELADLYFEQKIVAVKFYTGYDHFYPNDKKIMHALSALQEVGCPVIFHCGDCLNSVKCAKLKYSHPLNIDEVAVDFPKINFIIAHMGFPWHRDAAEVCYKNENVYADISGFVYGNFDPLSHVKFNKVIQEFLDIAGSDKLLFGTDFPISNQKSYIETLKSNFIYDNTIHATVLSAEYLTQNVIRAFKLNV